MGRHSKTVSKHSNRPRHTRVRAVDYGGHASGYARRRRRPNGVSVLSVFAVMAVLVLVSGTVFADRTPRIFSTTDRVPTHIVVPPLVIEPESTYPPGTLLDKDGNPVYTVQTVAPTSSAAGTTSAPPPSPTSVPRTTVSTTPAPTTVARPTVTVTPPSNVVDEPDTTPPVAQAPQATVRSNTPVTDAPPTQDFGGVPEHVARVGVFIKAQFNIIDVYGVGERPNNPRSDHPKGLALDFMVYDDKRKGDALRDCLQAHKSDWNITYVLWQVPDHFDHVHVSFEPNGVVRGLTCD